MVKNKKEENTILKSIREGYNLPEAYFKVKVDKAASREEVNFAWHHASRARR